MNTSTYKRRNSTVSTVKKSQATIPLAWARRNCRHESDERRGAGSIPACRKIDQTVLGVTTQLAAGDLIRIETPGGGAFGSVR